MDSPTKLVLAVGGGVIALLVLVVIVVGVWLCTHKNVHREHIIGEVNRQRQALANDALKS